MQLYDSLGPNPRIVRMFLLEKGVEIPSVQVDLMTAENRQAEYLKINPVGQVPALVLDDGTALAETVVICDYLEEKHPNPPLVGSTAEERAVTRLWTRRVEQQITGHLVDAFRFAEGLEMFKARMHVIPQAADDLKACAREGYAWLDKLMADGRSWIAGDRFSLADIVLYCIGDFCAGAGQPIPGEATAVQAWFEHAAARPSAEASLHPAAGSIGMRA